MVSLSCNGSFRTEHPRGEAVANVSCRNVKLSQRGCSVRVEQKSVGGFQGRTPVGYLKVAHRCSAWLEGSFEGRRSQDVILAG